MIALTLGVLLACHAALSYPSPYPGPKPVPAPGPSPTYYGGVYGGYGGYGGVGVAGVGVAGVGVAGYGGYGGYGCVEEVITPPVSPPVLNTVDVYDIATLGVIPAPPIEYVYPAVGYEAFGLASDCGYGGYPGYGGYVGYGGYGGYGYY